MLCIVFNFLYLNFVPDLIIKIKSYEKNSQKLQDLEAEWEQAAEQLEAIK